MLHATATPASMNYSVTGPRKSSGDKMFSASFWKLEQSLFSYHTNKGKLGHAYIDQKGIKTLNGLVFLELYFH